jgi:putative flippase GtrA
MNNIIRRIADRLPEKLRLFYYKYESALLYIFYGGLTTVVSLGSHYICLFLRTGTLTATSVSWICAVTFAFFTNKLYVFNSKDRSAHVILGEAWKFYGARLVSYFLELGFLLLTVDTLGFNKYICKIIAQVFILILNYLFSKFIVFKKKTK